MEGIRSRVLQVRILSHTAIFTNIDNNNYIYGDVDYNRNFRGYMREIKFRQPIFVDGKFSHFHYWGFLSDGSFVAPDRSWVDGAPSQQFTGIKDKNGVEVYEGDILKFSPSTPEHKEMIDRYWHWYTLYELTVRFVKGRFLPFSDFDGDFIEIFGNVYQHPHLTEVKTGESGNKACFSKGKTPILSPDGAPMPERAFPLPTPAPGNAWVTLRDHFAGEALPAFIEKSLFKANISFDDYKKTAGMCYQIADAMLEARKR